MPEETRARLAVNPPEIVTQQTPDITVPSKLDLALFRLAKWGLVTAVSLLYLFCYDRNFFFTPLLLLTFAYSFAALAHLLVDAVVYFLTEPVLLPELKQVLEKGIPRETKVAMVRPIFAKSTNEMETLLTNLRLDAVANQEAEENIKFIVIDNTRDESVRGFTRARIRELQGELGEDTVYYFHRNPKVDFFKKLGIYQDFIMLLREGWTRPGHYTNPKWSAWAKDTRDPKQPLWDEILGDPRGLGVESAVGDILKGSDIRLSEQDRIRFAFVSDADNRWPEGSVRKMVAKMLHPANRNITIFQPSIELSNPDENWFIRIHSWSRRMYGFDPIAKWRLYRFSPFFGKAAMNLQRYVKEVILSETLHPGKAASHDFQESLSSWTVLVEDVYLLEKSFSNKVSELARAAQWLWGDMETVGQYLLRPFEPGRKEHLWMLGRMSAGTLVYSVWVVATCVAWLFPAVGGVIHPLLLWVLFLSIAAASLGVPKFLVPFLEGRWSKTVPSLSTERDLSKILRTGILEAALTTLIHYLDLVYRSRAFIHNLAMQLRGREFVWVTTAMAELSLSKLSVAQCYRALSFAVGIGFALFLISTLGLLPKSAALFLLPYTASFLFGPLAIWLTSKPIKKTT